MQQSKIIVVVGMHRSGTSLACSLLEKAGVFFGAPSDFVRPNDENPRGFFEHLRLRYINDQYMALNDASWANVSTLSRQLCEKPAISLGELEGEAAQFLSALHNQAGDAPVGLKDPRLCLLAAAWDRLLPSNTEYVFVYRDPREVAQSLETRNGFPNWFSSYLTEKYLFHAANFLTNKSAVVVTYDGLLSQPYEELSPVIDRLQSDSTSKIPGEGVFAELIDEALYRSRNDQRDIQLGAGLLQKHFLFSGSANQKIMHRDIAVFAADVPEGEFSDCIYELEVANHLAYYRGRALELERQHTFDVKEVTQLRQEVALMGQQKDDMSRENDRVTLSLEQSKRSLEQSKRRLEAIESDLRASRARLGEADAFRARVGGLLTILDAFFKSLTWRLLQPFVILGLSLRRSSSGPNSLEVLRAEARSIFEIAKSQGTAAPIEPQQPSFTYKETVSSAHRRGSYDVSIIVLTRDGARHMERLLQSFLWQENPQGAEWLIVDHASSDDSEEVIRQFDDSIPYRLFLCDANHSFSQSNNFAAKHAEGDFVVFCNNDIVFDRPIVSSLISTLSDDSVGLVGLDLYYPDTMGSSSESIQHSGITFRWDDEFEFPRPVNSNSSIASTGVERVPAVTAALCAARKKTFNDVGGFDEAYVYGYEDVDLCLSIQRKLGKSIVVDHGLSAIHNESATQRHDMKAVVSQRRRKNIGVLKEKYGDYVCERFLPSYSGAPHGEIFRVGLVVTERDENTLAGDFFTASELAACLRDDLGWRTAFLPLREGPLAAYDASNLDCVISLLPNFDLTLLRNAKPGLITIAWLRNWFELWTEKPWFHRYSLAACSSEVAAAWVRENSAVDTFTLRIATSPERFGSGSQPTDASYASDYCFTGSFWGAFREIETFQPASIPHEFAVFGAGWEDHKNLGPASRGPRPYSEMSQVYSGTKLLIDDANHVTKSWGSVNSRVFDGLMSGVLVLTNGEIGSNETFEGQVPVWRDAEDLTRLVSYYLENPRERESLAAKLRKLVSHEHTYHCRARQLEKIVEDYKSKIKVAIKAPVPSWDQALQWGDYHFAVALAKALRNCGLAVRIDLLPDWYTPAATQDDVCLVLRGLSEYMPSSSQFNIMWNISHPDKVSHDEYDNYDHVFVASESHAREISKHISSPVTPLLQATDPDRFFNPKAEQKDGTILFVGNSRKIARPSVISAINQGLDISIYGSLWEGIVDGQFVKGDHIANNDLARFYASAGVVLNDHWSDMRDKGFISNRLFDAVATGAIVITDSVEGLDEVFTKNVLVCCEDFSDLGERVRQALAITGRESWYDPSFPEELVKAHSFDQRAELIFSVISQSHDEQSGFIQSVGQVGSKP